MLFHSFQIRKIKRLNYTVYTSGMHTKHPNLLESTCQSTSFNMFLQRFTLSGAVPQPSNGESFLMQRLEWVRYLAFFISKF